MFTIVAMAALQGSFRIQRHGLTAPLVITAWMFIGAVFSFGRLHGAPALGMPHLPTEAAHAIAVVSLTDAVTGILNSPAQVMLQQNVWTGAIFLVALAVNSRISCAAAALGSAIGVVIAWSLGAAPSEIRGGLYGFNAVLTAIAFTGIFFLLHRTTMLLSILAVCVSTIMYCSLLSILGPFGLPALTAPFIATTWLCLLAGRSLPRLKASFPATAATPEENLRAARQAASKK